MTYVTDLKKISCVEFLNNSKYFEGSKVVRQMVKQLEIQRMSELVNFCINNKSMTTQFVLSYVYKSIVMLQLCLKGHEYFDIYSFAGYKLVMEDEYVIHTDFTNKLQICAVFDGHSGSQCVTYLKDNYLNCLYNSTYFKYFLETRNQIDMIFALKNITLELDKYFIDNGIKGGSTGIVVIVTQDNIYTSNVGDSRAIVIKKYIGNNEFDYFATCDQKPVMYEDRIKKAGGFVKHNRVDGCLAVANAFGDIHFKNNKLLPISEQKVVADSDVNVVQNTFDVVGIILGCDGIYDVYENEELIYDCAMFASRYKGNLAELILNMALLKDSYDNLTICTSIKKYKYDMEETKLISEETFNFLKLIKGFIATAKKITQSQLAKQQILPKIIKPLDINNEQKISSDTSNNILNYSVVTTSKLDKIIGANNKSLKKKKNKKHVSK